MDKMTFASYKFKPSDVVDGLNRYFAETKAYRYLRASLEIRRGVCYNNPDCMKDIIFTNSPPDRHTRSGHVCWNHYLICDPEEVVGVAINWLREEHDIFYTPGMEVPVEDFDVYEAAREYEKETRKDRISGILCTVEELQKSLYEAKRRTVALEKGHAEKSKIIDQQVARIKELEEQIAEEAGENSVLRGNVDYFADLAQGRQKALSNLHDEIDKVYREIFDCSNGDPEGTYKETLQDILTEYKQVLKLKDVAEEKAIKYKELARENEEKANQYKDAAKENRVQWNNTKDQLQWAQKENRKWLEKYETLKSELNEMKTRTSDIFCEENLDMVPVARVREALGIGEGSDIFEWIAFLKKSAERAHSEMYMARGERHELEKKIREIKDICER